MPFSEAFSTYFGLLWRTFCEYTKKDKNFWWYAW